MRRSLGILTLFYCLSLTIQAQDKPHIKFGKIAAEDFTINSSLVDSGTKAVVLADIGSSEFEGNAKGWFSVVFKRHKRVKILSKDGFDAGLVSIVLYRNNDSEQRLEDVQAMTYNLENGVVTSTKLDKKDIIEDQPQKRFTQKKFTFPALKVGSIIEYTYTVKSDFLTTLHPWEFQGKYPCLWSEYEVAVPEFFNYVLLAQGYLSLTKKNETHRGSFTIRQSDLYSNTRSFSVAGDVLFTKWTVKDVPAIREESFTSTLANHISKIEFQLSLIRLPNQSPREVLTSWPKVAERMLEAEDFGLAYTRGNNWLNDDMKLVTAGATSPEEKARKIYEYVRDNFTCTSYVGTRLTEPNSLKEIFRTKSGRVSDINLLLLAMLRHEGIQCEPVLASLRNRGVVHGVYPLVDRFNYLLCQVTLPSGIVYLDASHRMMGFGRLSAACYNGAAWVLTAAPYRVDFPTDSLQEKKRVSFILINGASGNMDGAVNAVLGENESLLARTKMLREKAHEYGKEMEKEIGMNASVSNVQFDSLKRYEDPVEVHYDLMFKFNDEDVIYFNPLLNEGIKKNPFTSAARSYPVEMPFAFDNTFVLDMEVPKGYVVDEMPKPVRFKFNEDEGLFEYLFSRTADKIQMRCRMWLNKTVFSPEDYEGLREFFAFAIKKESEQIVFKKKKS